MAGIRAEKKLATTLHCRMTEPTRKSLYRACAPVPLIPRNARFTCVSELPIPPCYDQFCSTCFRSSNKDNPIVVCVGCDAPFHLYCHSPPVPRMYSEKKHLIWVCSSCNTQENGVPHSVLSRKQRSLASETMVLVNRGNTLTEQNLMSGSALRSDEWSSPVVRGEFVIQPLSKTEPSDLNQRLEAASACVLIDEGDPDAFEPSWSDKDWAKDLKGSSQVVERHHPSQFKSRWTIPVSSACFSCGKESVSLSNLESPAGSLRQLALLTVVKHFCVSCRERYFARKLAISSFSKATLVFILEALYVLDSKMGLLYDLVAKDPKNLLSQWGVLRQLTRGGTDCAEVKAS